MTTKEQKEALKSAREELRSVRPKQTYPAMSREGVDAVIEAEQKLHTSTDQPFYLRLSSDDFRMLMETMKFVSEQTAYPNGSEVGRWAEDFASSIAESLGVEWV